MMRLPQSSLLFKGLASEDTNVKKVYLKLKLHCPWQWVTSPPLPSPVIQLWIFNEMMADVDLVGVGLEREW